MKQISIQYFDEFCKIGQFRNIKKGECLDCKGAYEKSAFCLVKGLCALTSITKSGDEKIYHYFSNRRIIGFVPAYIPDTVLETQNSLFVIYAKTDCEVYEISYDHFCDFIAHNPTLSDAIILSLVENFIGVLYHFNSLQEDPTPIRLCKTLLDLAENHHGKLKLHSHFTYVELAKYLGVHTVTISRIMATLKTEGIILKDGHSIIIKNKDKLIDYIKSEHPLPY